MKYAISHKIAVIIGAVILFVGIALGVAGWKAAERPRKETIRKSWERARATVVDRWKEGKDCWVELEGEFPEGPSTTKIRIKWNAFSQLSTGDKVVVYRNPSPPGEIALDKYGNLDDMPVWCYFLFSGMSLFFGIGLTLGSSSSQKHAFHCRKPGLKSTNHVCLAVLFGFAGLCALQWLAAAVLLRPAAEIRENGSEREARIERKVREIHHGGTGGGNHAGKHGGTGPSPPAEYLYLTFPSAPDDAKPIRLPVSSHVFERVNKGDVVKVWFYRNRYWLDEYGERENQEPPSLPLSLASVCGSFFLMGYFIRKAVQAKRRERMGGR